MPRRRRLEKEGVQHQRCREIKTTLTVLVTGDGGVEGVEGGGTMAVLPISK